MDERANKALDDWDKEVKRAFTTKRTVCEHGVTVSLFQCPSCELRQVTAERDSYKAKLEHAIRLLQEFDAKPSRDDLVDMKNLYGI